MSHSGFLKELQGILQSSSILSQGVSIVPSAKKVGTPKQKFLVCFELYLMVIGDFPRKMVSFWSQKDTWGFTTMLSFFIFCVCTNEFSVKSNHAKFPPS